ncbi:hypothetical protein ACU8NU_26895 (plasmid) [Rhizobium leguminosarum]
MRRVHANRGHAKMMAKWLNLLGAKLAAAATIASPIARATQQVVLKPMLFSATPPAALWRGTLSPTEAYHNGL